MKNRATGVRYHELLKELGWPLLVLMLLAALLGGGGSAFGIFNLVPQLFAIVLLALFAVEHRAAATRIPLAFKVLLAATMLLPLLQLVPLPEAIWSAMPGRELVAETAAIIGRQDTAFPWTMDRGRTLIAFAALIPPLAILLLLFGQVGSSRTDRALLAQKICMVIVALAAANFLIGSVQMLSGNRLNLYPVFREGRMFGLFQSHNTSALFFVIGLLCLLGLRTAGKAMPGVSALKSFLALCFVVGVLLTQSRSGTVLLGLPAFLFTAQFVAESRRPKRLVAIALLALPLVFAGGFFLFRNSSLANIAGRFGSLEDARPNIWADTLSGIERYWPLGSGIGTFDEVYPLQESLETLLPYRTGRAHNDYLEIMLEAGVVGMALVLAWILYLGFMSLRAWKSGGDGGRPMVLPLSLGLAAIALQSALDYPLRNQLMLCVGGLLVTGLLILAMREKGRGR